MKPKPTSLFSAGIRAALVIFAAALSATSVLADAGSSCQTHPQGAAAPQSPAGLEAAASAAQADLTDPASPYDALYPYYVEMCAVGQRQPFGQEKEGRAGHMATYIKGLCRDKASAMPRVKLCDAADGDPLSPETGVGVSVDSDFKNVNWSAIDGKAMFLAGAASDANRGDEDAIINQTIDRAVAQGAFRNIQLNDKVEKGRHTGESHEHFVARQVIGTDYALSLSRRTDCVRIPVKKEMLEPMMVYLNSKNELYFGTGRPYVWSGIYDNCAHLAHNMLAAAGLLAFKKTDQSLPVQVFNLAVPADELLGQIRTGHDDDLLLHPDKIYRSERLRALLDRDAMLPFQDGVLLEQLAGNRDVPHYFDANNVMWRPERPLDKYNESKVVGRLAADPAYTDLKTSLEQGRARVAAAIAARGSSYDPGRLASSKNAPLSGRALFDAKFDAYLAAKTRELDEKLARFASF